MFIISLIISICLSIFITFLTCFNLFGGGIQGKTYVQESELSSTVVGTYFYNGMHTVNAYDVLTYWDILEDAKQDNGSYMLPSATDVTDYIKNQVLLDVARNDEHLIVSDADYEVSMILTGLTTDIGEIANTYDVSKDFAKTLIDEFALSRELEDKVVTDAFSDAKSQPQEPSSGDIHEQSQDYASYIIDLVGDAWDSSKGSWSSNGSAEDYENALSPIPFDGNAASYVQALTAYRVYCDNLLSSTQEGNKAWSDFQDNIFGHLALFLPVVY